MLKRQFDFAAVAALLRREKNMKPHRSPRRISFVHRRLTELFYKIGDDFVGFAEIDGLNTAALLILEKESRISYRTAAMLQSVRSVISAVR